MRIIFVPQYPTQMRYQEWWFTEFPKQFESAGHEVVTLGKDYVRMMSSRRGPLSIFSPISMSIEFETEQIREYMDIDLQKDDVLFLSDLSFPGFFSNVFFHKRCSNMFAFCHATSINKFDYFESVSNAKFPIEFIHSGFFKKIFVGSHYHKEKLGWKNILVTRLPFPPIKKSNITEKKYNIISVSRPSKQKVDLKLEEAVARKFEQINRPISNTWEDYFDNLALSKVLLITAHEDTFGYQIVDAILNECIPIARNSFAYPEILPREFLYDSEEELLEKIDYVLNNDVDVPKIRCKEEMENFYKTILNEMKGRK